MRRSMLAILCHSAVSDQSPTDLAHVSLRKGYEPIEKLEGTMGQAALSQLLHEGSQPSTVQLRHALCCNLQSKDGDWKKVHSSLGMRVCRAARLPNIAHMRDGRHAVSDDMP